MQRPTYDSIRRAAKKSDKAALRSSRNKYHYLLQLTRYEFLGLPKNFLTDIGCALCLRHSNSGTCPFELNCSGFCLDEYGALCRAKNRCHYNDFLLAAAKIYVKLSELLV